jgi:hypothetical protein
VDSDGTYPFAVAGHQVKKVGAATGTTKVVLTIKEKASPDIAAEPDVTYARTSQQPVRERVGLQASNRTFTNPKPLDLDGAGYTSAGGDCAPKNPSRHPGASDLPDPDWTSLLDAFE